MYHSSFVIPEGYVRQDIWVPENVSLSGEEILGVVGRSASVLFADVVLEQLLAGPFDGDLERFCLAARCNMERIVIGDPCNPAVVTDGIDEDLLYSSVVWYVRPGNDINARSLQRELVCNLSILVADKKAAKLASVEDVIRVTSGGCGSTQFS
ncbi:MAG TPA: hypothetical protein VJB87_03065 [Candidatus Nanoarchaeia archaeon]|nr:hypothetical protein [Candidatus Nanoarchaeia archaeon]